MVGVEALAHGTPVIATDLPGVREGVGDGGILVPLTASSKEWLSAIRRVLSDLDRWRSQARRRAEELFERQDCEAKQFRQFIPGI